MSPIPPAPEDNGWMTKLSLTLDLLGFSSIALCFAVLGAPILGQCRAHTGMDYYMTLGGFSLNLSIFWDLSHFIQTYPWVPLLLCGGVGVLEWIGLLRLSGWSSSIVRFVLAILVAIFIGGHCLKEWIIYRLQWAGT
jgi:hypothetical protein